MIETTEDGRNAMAKKKSAKKSAKPISYTSTTPSGLMPVGTTVKYIGGAKLKNDWLKKNAVGRVFGYRPGRKGGGLYAVRFEGGATLLSVKRIEKASAKESKAAEKGAAGS
jgi:hypothetical protein